MLGRVSVPLRGFCFSTSSGLNDFLSVTDKFPSPYGDFVFQPAEETKRAAVERGFRPLTGILFFNSFFDKKFDTEEGDGFRPLTGILFFNIVEFKFVQFREVVSVPLRGFCFSTPCL